MGTGSFPCVKCGRGVLLTTHPLLVPRSWKSRAIPLPTLWATLGLQRDHFTFFTPKVTGPNVSRDRRNPHWASVWFTLEYYLQVTQDYLLSNLYKPSMYGCIWAISEVEILSLIRLVRSARNFQSKNNWATGSIIHTRIHPLPTQHTRDLVPPTNNPAPILHIKKHAICKNKKMLMYVFVKNHQPEDGHKRRNM